jgi:quercetin dioxygenase-like cupin family protein
MLPGDATSEERAMSERPLLAHETDYAWEYDDERSGPDELRWRTLVSGDRTPSRGLSLGVLEVPPGAELAPHHHRPQEVYYLTEGRAEVYLEGEWRDAEAGDVVYVPGDAVHGVRNRGAALCRLVWAFPTDTYTEVEYHGGI